MGRFKLGVLKISTFFISFLGEGEFGPSPSPKKILSQIRVFLVLGGDYLGPLETSTHLTKS